MAKKQKEETPNVNATANRDIVQRLNFLYQASVYLQSVSQPESSTTSTSRNPKGKERDLSQDMDIDPVSEIPSANEFKRHPKKKPRRRIASKKTTADLARSYVQCMRVVGQKTTVKIDPSLKRSLCSNCSTTLVPGFSASVRVKNSSSHGHIMVYACLHCKATKRIPAPPSGPSLDSNPLKPTGHPQSFEVPADHSREDKNIHSNKGHPRSRPLPLFARPEAGHVVFRGNTQLPLDAESGFGLCFA